MAIPTFNTSSISTSTIESTINKKINTTSILSPIIKLTPKQVNDKIDMTSKIRDIIQNQSDIISKFLK